MAGSGWSLGYEGSIMLETLHGGHPRQSTKTIYQKKILEFEFFGNVS